MGNTVSEAQDYPGDTNNGPPKTVLITGCNSGVGLEAAFQIASKGNVILFLACRTLRRSQDAAKEIQSKIPSSGVILVPLECDLSSLKSLERCSCILHQELQKEIVPVKSLDVVCFNAAVLAGVKDKKPQRTDEGFEKTVGVNYLGHYYLYSLLLPMMTRQTGRLIITCCCAHIIQGSLGGLAGFKRDDTEFEMIDDGEYAPLKAYFDSKLCLVLFAREAQRRLKLEDTGIKVYCFDPGFISATKLFRNQNLLLKKTLQYSAKHIHGINQSLPWSGKALKFLVEGTYQSNNGEFEVPYYRALSNKHGNPLFAQQVKVECASKIHNKTADDDLAKRLWSYTERIVGMPS